VSCYNDNILQNTGSSTGFCRWIKSPKKRRKKDLTVTVHFLHVGRAPMNNITSDKPMDAKKLVSHFGGTTQLWRLLMKHDQHISIKTIDSWITRGCVPTRRLVQLGALGATIGKPIDINNYINK
jgi:hypothetical protein